MLPIRAIAEALGANVQWDDATQTATLTLGVKTVKVTIGQNSILVNGQPVAMDTAAAIKDGRTLLPVRAVGEAMGAQIGWDDQTKTVSVNK
jgi:N-acetylmuramoyl-L-alanine amidase